MKKKYCYNCDNFINIKIRKEKLNVNIKECIITLLAEIAYCEHCDEKVYVSSLEKKIIEKANKFYMEIIKKNNKAYVDKKEM